MVRRAAPRAGGPPYIRAIHKALNTDRRGAPCLVSGGLILYGDRVFVPCLLTPPSQVCKLAHTAAHKVVHQRAQQLHAYWCTDHGWDKPLAVVCARLLHDQAYVSHHYDAHHRELQFSQGAWVWPLLFYRSVRYWVASSRG